MNRTLRLTSVLSCLFSSVPVLAQPAAAPAPAPAAPVEPAAPVPPAALTAGKEGTFKPGLLLQGWYLFDDAAAVHNTFRLRRAEISAKGEIIPQRFAYAVMFDVARLLEFQNKTLPVAPAQPMMPQTVTAKQPAGASSILQDVFITWQTAFADVSIGQFKIPVSYEGYNSSSKLLFPERALVSAKYGDKREVGLRIAKQFKYAGYSVGLFNGTGVNATDSDESKDGGLRVEAYPMKGLLLAGVVYATLAERGKAGAKDRYEGDVRFERGPVMLQAEYIHGRDVAAGAMGATTTTRGQGFYTAAGFRPLEVLQVVGRFGYLDPDKTVAKNHQLGYEGVLNYYVRQFEARLQLSYSRFQSADPARKAQNVLILAAQAGY